MKQPGHVTPPVSRMLVPIHFVFFPVIVLSFFLRLKRLWVRIPSQDQSGWRAAAVRSCLSAGSSLAVRRSELSAVLNAAAASSTQPVRGHAAGISPNRARLSPHSRGGGGGGGEGRVLFRQFVPTSGVKVLELRGPR